MERPPIATAAARAPLGFANAGVAELQSELMKVMECGEIM